MSPLNRQGLFLENRADDILGLRSQKPFIVVIVQQKKASKLMIMLSLQDIHNILFKVYGLIICFMYPKIMLLNISVWQGEIPIFPKRYRLH